MPANIIGIVNQGQHGTSKSLLDVSLDFPVSIQEHRMFYHEIPTSDINSSLIATHGV